MPPCQNLNGPFSTFFQLNSSVERTRDRIMTYHRRTQRCYPG